MSGSLFWRTDYAFAFLFFFSLKTLLNFLLNVCKIFYTIENNILQQYSFTGTWRERFKSLILDDSVEVVFICVLCLFVCFLRRGFVCLFVIAFTFFFPRRGHVEPHSLLPTCVCILCKGNELKYKLSAEETCIG